jgi:hypothetical protein
LKTVARGFEEELVEKFGEDILIDPNEIQPSFFFFFIFFIYLFIFIYF